MSIRAVAASLVRQPLRIEVRMLMTKTGIRKVDKRKIRWKNELEGFLFVLPWIIGFFLFSLYPIFMSGYYSFTDFSAIKDPKWVGIDNYKDLFLDPLFYRSMINTLIYVAFSVVLCIFMALIIASMLNGKWRGRTIFRSIFFLPSVVPVVASTMIWVWVFDPINGYLNKILEKFGVPTINWLGDPSWTMTSVIIITLWGMGSSMVIFLAAMQDVPTELYEAAGMDGAGSIAKFINITLPGIAHVILYQIVLVMINGFQYFTQVYIIIRAQSGNISQGINGGPRDSLMMYPLYLFYNAFTGLKMGKAAAMSWILFLVVCIITFLITKISKKWVNKQ